VELQQVLDGVKQHRVAQPEPASCVWNLADGNAVTSHYSNSDARLGIDFQVEKLAFTALQVMDPRLVVIAPGACNEKHRHAHESIFVVLSGDAQIQIGKECVNLNQGGVAYVPRWVVHQSTNRSSSKPLKLLAITDFGLTSAVLGDYDSRTRLKSEGDDAFSQDPIQP